MAERFDVVTIAELEDGQGWSPIRKRLGVQAFGVNAWTAHEAGQGIIPEHDEAPSGHEELYVVLAGRAGFVVDEAEIDAPAGTVVFVRDPTAKRGAVAHEPGTTVLAVGAAPGRAYRPRAWETNAEIPGMFDRGEYEQAKQLLTDSLGRYEDDAGVLYNLACAEALLGERDEAIDHLRAALQNHPAFAESARDDSDFEAIRGDPRFAELVGGPA